MLEAEVEDTVVEAARCHGWVARKLKWIGRVAGPDHYFLKDGRTVLIEFKKRGAAPNALQKKEIALLKRHGADVHVVDTIAAGLRVLGIEPEWRA